MFALTFPLTLKKAILSFSVKNKMHLNRFNNSRDKKTKTASASGLASTSSAARTSPSSSHSMPEPEFERNHSIFLTQLFHFFHFKLKKGLVFQFSIVRRDSNSQLDVQFFFTEVEKNGDKLESEFFLSFLFFFSLKATVAMFRHLLKVSEKKSSDLGFCFFQIDFEPTKNSSLLSPMSAALPFPISSLKNVSFFKLEFLIFFSHDGVVLVHRGRRLPRAFAGRPGISPLAVLHFCDHGEVLLLERGRSPRVAAAPAGRSRCG